jgi:hypothetical protein
MYAQNSKKIITYSTNERGRLLCDLSFFQMLSLYDLTTSFKLNKGNDYETPIVKERGTLCLNIFGPIEDGCKVNILVASSYIIIEKEA